MSQVYSGAAADEVIRIGSSSGSSTVVGGIQMAGPSTIAMVLLFGTMIFATAGLAARTWLLGDYRAFMAVTRSRSDMSTSTVPRPLELNFLSVYTFLHHSSVFALLLLFMYVLEHHPPFPHSGRDREGEYDDDYMVFLCVLFLLVCFQSVRRNDGKKTTTKKTNESSSSSSSSSMKSGGSGRKKKKQPSILGNELGLSSAVSGAAGNNSDGTVTEHVVANEDDDGDIAKQQRVGTEEEEQQTKRGASASTSTSVIIISPDNDVLNRHQTYEWKGWMVLLFLLCQYTNATGAVNTWHNVQQTLRSAFLFLSGFANFLYFYTTEDYSLGRVLRTLWRINFLVVFLCLTMGTPYILYYVCPLHSAVFLMVYFIMKTARRYNYTKYALRAKLLGLAMIIYVLWDLDLGLFRLVHMPFVTVGPPEEGAPLGPMWQWYFETFLHHWIAFLGVVFGANFPIVSLFTHRLEGRGRSKKHRTMEWLAKLSIGLAFGGATYVWAVGPLRYDRYIYNDTHGYFCFIPILAYVYFRNLTPTARQYSVAFFGRLGRTALELYLVHHHALLTSNGRTALTLIPGSPKCNLILVSMLYYVLCRKLYRLTLYLRGMILGENGSDERRMVHSVGICALVLVVSYVVAVVLDRMDLVSPGTIAALVIICGILSYQTILDTTWRAYRQSSFGEGVGNAGGGGEREDDANAIAKACPPIIGTMVILLLGFMWQGLAIMGAGTVGPLPSSCQAMANGGKWVPVDVCSEYNRGLGYRSQSSIAAFGHCNKSRGWAWENVPSNSHCSFTHRSVTRMQEQLNHRSLVFIGDSMTRNLYHAVCRALGDTSVGTMYDATVPTHSDVTKYFGDTVLEYKWAPLAIDELNKLKDYTRGEVKPGQQQAGRGRPDLIVIGGGAWDQLHVWATDEDQESHKNAVVNLAAEMTKLHDKLNIPTIWFVPTTINTDALNSDEKRDHMSEERIGEMRKLYVDLGVTHAASFVLDGPAFTRDVVGESYDGVHYPPYVYNAGAQILSNAMDWVLPKRDFSEPFTPPIPGAMANPFLGLMMLCFCVIGLFFFDAFVGFSYLGSVFANGAMPSDLYEESFAPLHSKHKLPPISARGSIVEGGKCVDDELLALVRDGSGDHKDLEMSANHHAR